MIALSMIFAATVVLMFALDVGVANRRGVERPGWVAGLMSALWVALALGFALAIHVAFGHVRMLEFVTGYIIEYALSVDNLFVFLTIFSSFRVPSEHQHRVLFWGILGAVVLRLAFILAGASLLRRFHWFEYVLGVVLLLTALRILRGGHGEVDPERSRVVRIFRRFVPSISGFADGRFFIRSEGQWYATTLLLVLALIEATDVVFALDSIPAIFAVTSDPFIVFTSNVFAVLGLRSLYGALKNVVDRLRYLNVGLGAVLLFVGMKMLLHDVLHVPIWLSLVAIAAILGTAGCLSLVHRNTVVSTRRGPR